MTPCSIPPSPSCAHARPTEINTYKHRWWICPDCGNAASRHKAWPWLFWFPHPLLWPHWRVLKNPDAIYDAMTNPRHAEYSKKEARLFVKNLSDPAGLDLFGKTILDISGGNGHVIDEIRKDFAARVTLTEFNQRSVDYARDTLGLEAKRFDFAADRLTEIFPGRKYDVVLLRACLMFCRDAEGFLKDLRGMLHSGGAVVVQYLVWPTLGTMLRTQCDEYNYQVFYDPDRTEEMFSRAGFKRVWRQDEDDPDGFSYGFDEDYVLAWLKFFYEAPAAKRMARTLPPRYRSRERRRSNMLFRLPPG